MRHCVLILLALLAASPAGAEPTYDADRFTQAVYSQGRVWLLDDSGDLVSLAEGDADVRKEAPGGPVLGICAATDSVVAVTGEDGGEAIGAWTVRRLDAQGWRPVGMTGGGGEVFHSVTCDGGRVITVGQHTVTILSGQSAQSIRLNGDLPGGVVVTHPDGDVLYVGVNAGEWGGGLHRLNLRTGLVETINALGGSDPCDGPLYAQCDPVTGIAAMPGKPGCIAVSTALEHMMTRKGSLLSVCDRTVATLYAPPLKTDPPPPSPWVHTVPFRGLVARNGVLWSAGADGLYRFDPARGKGRATAMPAFHKVGPASVSFAVPGMVLVQSAINQRHAAGGGAVLMVVRPEPGA